MKNTEDSLFVAAFCFFGMGLISVAGFIAWIVLEVAR